jgi:hypothetical protein
VGCTREKISRRIREPGRQWKVRARIEGTSTSGWVKEKRGGWIESQAGERRLGRDHRVPSNSGVGKREEKKPVELWERIGMYVGSAAWDAWLTIDGRA